MDTAKKLADALRAIMGKSTRSSPGVWGRIVCPRDAELELGFQALAGYDALSTPAAADAPEPVALTDEQIDALVPEGWAHRGALYEIARRLEKAMRAASQPAPVEENVLDLDKAFWEQLMQAAGESEWIPQEHYYVNDWVADCCNFLRTGSSISAPVSVPEVEIPEGLQCNVCDGEPGLRVLGSRAWTACSVCHGSGRTDVLGPYVPGTSRKKVDAAPTPSKGEA